jgi:hypothetical protein
MVALGCHGSLGESGPCAGNELLNITIAGTVRRAGRLQGPDDEMEGIEVKYRKTREWGGLCTIERQTHLSL